MSQEPCFFLAFYYVLFRGRNSANRRRRHFARAADVVTAVNECNFATDCREVAPQPYHGTNNCDELQNNCCQNANCYRLTYNRRRPKRSTKGLKNYINKI